MNISLNDDFKSVYNQRIHLYRIEEMTSILSLKITEDSKKKIDFS